MKLKFANDYKTDNHSQLYSSTDYKVPEACIVEATAHTTEKWL